MTDILVVFKKNFESVHDKSLETVREVLTELQNSRDIRIEIRAREQVRRADFIGRDLEIVLVGREQLKKIYTNKTEIKPMWG